MARGKKTGGKNFAKGNPGGPGRPRIPEEQREALRQVQTWRDDNRVALQEILQRLKVMSVPELQKLAAAESVNVLECVVARALLRVASSARIQDLETLRFIMCGAEPKQIELSGPGGEPLRPFGNVSREELVAAWKHLQSLTGEPPCNSTPPPPQSSESSPPSLPPPSGTAL